MTKTKNELAHEAYVTYSNIKGTPSVSIESFDGSLQDLWLQVADVFIEAYSTQPITEGCSIAA